MKVAVLGPGAVGGVLAVGLVRAGVPVVCVARPDTANLIASSGLTLRHGSQEAETVRPEATTELHECVDLLLVTVKATTLDDALGRIQAPPRTVIPLLNGIEHMQTIRSRLAESDVVAGSVSLIEAYLEEPGTIVQTTPAVVLTLASDAGAETAELLRRAGAEVRVDGSEHEVLWQKLARQAPVAAATALTQRPIGGLRNDPEWRPRLKAAVDETCAVACRRSLADGGRPVGDHRRDAAWTDLVHGTRHRRGPTVGARRDHRWSRASRPPSGHPDADTRTPACRSGRRMPSAIALIPARSGSERVKDKNIRPLAGHPLLAYAIATARQAGIFDRVVCSTDSGKIAEVAQRYGADIPFLRPSELATSTSPDIEWLTYTLEQLGEHYDLFAIVRATNPFRGPDVLQRGLQQLLATPEADSIRAVELVKQHPGKMWVVDGKVMRPLLEQAHLDVAWHAGQYQALPEIYVQNSALEIAWTRVVSQTGTREGRVVAPFFTSGHEGFNVDDEEDWARARALVDSGEATLPGVERPSRPYPAAE